MISPKLEARARQEMVAENGPETLNVNNAVAFDCRIQEFALFETESKFYMIGRDNSRTLWKVLKIDRESSELGISEDTLTYSSSECNELLQRIDEGNKPTGGLKFVTYCYGIVGFVKFLRPYYMLLITGRRQIGVICGHKIYAITKTKMIALQNSSDQLTATDSKKEKKYKKLFCTVDLTKDFFFSYSYHIMRSLQKNACDGQMGQKIYETMFVWNKYLTNEIRHRLENTIWTVALVHGFFRQVKHSVSGKDIVLTLIARRSHHHAGTRFLKRGLNDKGKVANDIETEQIVFEDTPGRIPPRICSVVQNRGSIPLFWSQKTSKLNAKPDIVLQNKDKDYAATRLHFDDLVDRYEQPVVILNLIKSNEKKPRESILRSEYARAIEFINNELLEENHLKYLHWDLHKHTQRNAEFLLTWMGVVGVNVLNLTGFFNCEVTADMAFNRAMRCNSKTSNADHSSILQESGEDNVMLSNTSQPEETSEVGFSNRSNYSIRPLRLQKGVLRTNCIDCLDRTNVAQYVYGLAALGQQLHVLNLINIPRIDLDDPLADVLMKLYETMGDTLALQYGGSGAHNKIFSERRGLWRAATQSQELLRSLQRYYSNAYMDTEKQSAINLYLGYFKPQQGKPAIWELDPDDNERSFQRSPSDGDILQQTDTPSSSSPSGGKNSSHVAFYRTNRQGGDASELAPDILNHKSDLSHSIHTPPDGHLFSGTEQYSFGEVGDSNFMDLDWFSSFGDFCDEKTIDRFTVMTIPRSEDIVNSITTTASAPLSKKDSQLKGRIVEIELPCVASQTHDYHLDISDRSVNWVMHGGTLCHSHQPVIQQSNKCAT